ncbi:hypothetical protein [Streptomyces sp. NPDC054863]
MPLRRCPSTDPGQFFALALKTVYGAAGQADWAAPQAALLRGTARTTSAARGELAWTISEGPSPSRKNGAKPEIRVHLRTTAFTGTFADPAAPLRSLALAPAAPPALGSIVPSDPDRLVRRFGELFFNPLKWPQLSVEFQRDPVTFFRSYLGLFFPAQVTFAVPLTATTANGSPLNLTGKGAPHMLLRDPAAKEFPPRGAHFTLVEPLTGTAGGDTLTLDAMNCTITHRTR